MLDRMIYNLVVYIKLSGSTSLRKSTTKPGGHCFRFFLKCSTCSIVLFSPDLLFSKKVKFWKLQTTRNWRNNQSGLLIYEPYTGTFLFPFFKQFQPRTLWHTWCPTWRRYSSNFFPTFDQKRKSWILLPMLPAKE